MGAGSNILSKKNTTRLSQALGVNVERVLCDEGGGIAYGRTPDHQHLVIDRYTLTYKVEKSPVHWSSCE